MARIVLACSSYFIPRGGIAIYNREAFRALKAAGHVVMVLTPDVPQHADSEFVNTPIGSDLDKERLEIDRIYNKIINFAPDVVLSSDNIYAIGLFRNLPDHITRISVSHMARGYIARAATASAPHTDWIVSLSDCSGKMIQRQSRVASNSVRTVYNFVENNTGEPSSPRRSEPLRIIFPGGRRRYKRPDTVASIAKSLRSHPEAFLIEWLGEAGNWSSHLESRSCQVTFHGNLQHREALDCYENAHVFLLPSTNEGCPMSMLEAMQRYCVPIVSDCPSAMREIVEDGHSGFVCAVGDHRGMAERIFRLREDPELLQSMQLNAKRRVQECASETAWLDRMTELFCRRPGRKEPTPGPHRIRWHRRPGRWQRPTTSYLFWRIGFPNLIPF